MNDLILSNNIVLNRTEFLNKVRAVSERLKINPNWLMWVMWKESRINPQAVNKTSNATGLIQFMPSTATSLGTSVEKLKSMSNVEQLDWVEKYYKPFAGKIKSVADLYLVTFFPAAIGKPDNYVMQTTKLTAERIAKSNPGVDLNKDNKITVGEFKNYVLKGAPKDILAKLVGSVGGGFAILALLVTFFF